MFDDPLAHYNEGVIEAFLGYRARRKDGVAGRSQDLRDAVAAAGAIFISASTCLIR